MKMNNKQTWIGIFALIGIEQGIKIIINSNFLDKEFPILPPLLYFSPVFNRHYSWFNSMMQLGVSKWIHIVLTAILGMLIYLFYQYLRERLGNIKIINVMFAFLFSGALCSLIDKLFWNGSLDYILVNGFFTFDLKDVYLNVFNGLLVLALLLKSKALKQLDDKDILRDFTKYILHK
jgi:signal peptidase II